MPITINSKILAIVSMQNLFGFSVIILFVFFLFYRGDLILKFIKKIRYENIFIIYVILYNLIIPFTSFNSGIDLRQKWMCLIIIFYLALKFISYSVKDRQKQKQAKTKYHI